MAITALSFSRYDPSLLGQTMSIGLLAQGGNPFSTTMMRVAHTLADLEDGGNFLNETAVTDGSFSSVEAKFGYPGPGGPKGFQGYNQLVAGQMYWVMAYLISDHSIRTPKHAMFFTNGGTVQAPALPAQVLVFEDTFHRPDNPTALGNGWVADDPGNVYGIESNKAKLFQAGSDSSLAHRAMGLSDCFVKMTVDPTAIENDNVEMGLRVQDVGHFLEVYSGGSNIGIADWAGFAIASPQFGNLSINDNLGARLSGSIVLFYVDGLLVWGVDLSTTPIGNTYQNKTGHGFIIFGGSHFVLDYQVSVDDISSVVITSIIPDEKHAVVQWQSNAPAAVSECRIALFPDYLSDPSKCVSKPGSVGTSFSVSIPNVGLGDEPLAPGTKFFCQCSAQALGGSKVYSSIHEFSTTGSRIAPPDNFQAAAVTL